MAIADAGGGTEEIDYLIFGTMTPDRLIPVALRQCKTLGLGQIPCLDIRIEGAIHFTRCKLRRH